MPPAYPQGNGSLLLRLCILMGSPGASAQLEPCSNTNKQASSLIYFPKLKGIKIDEVQIPNSPGSSLKSADHDGWAVGLGCSFRKERAKYRAQPFIKLVPFIY